MRARIKKVHRKQKTKNESKTIGEINDKKYAERGKNNPRMRSITYPPHANLESEGRLSRGCTCVCVCFPRMLTRGPIIMFYHSSILLPSPSSPLNPFLSPPPSAISTAHVFTLSAPKRHVQVPILSEAFAVDRHGRTCDEREGGRQRGKEGGEGGVRERGVCRIQA